MKIKNNNAYSVMYGMEFIKAGEVKEIPDKEARLLLNHPNVSEYVTVEDVATLENENKKLKDELELANLKAEADKLGISYRPNIGADTLKKKIAAAKK